MNRQPASPWKSLRLGILVLAALIVYAYGFQVTKVNLDEFRKESRQESRIRVMRALARPDIFEYQQEETRVIAPIYIPCPNNIRPNPPTENTQPYLKLTPGCGKPGEEIKVEGFNFPPNVKAPLYFIPSADPADKLALQKGNIQADSNGHFIFPLKLPDRTSDQVQYIRVIIRRNIGLPHFSATAVETGNKIVETIFLALLATTIGTIFSIPISFFAARNLMKDVKSSLTQIALSILGWPLGVWGGLLLARWMRELNSLIRLNILATTGLIVGCAFVTYFLFRFAFFHQTRKVSPVMRLILPQLAQIVALLLTVQCFFLLSQLGITVGGVIVPYLGKAAFLGNFIKQLSDVTLTTLPAVLAICGGAILGGLLGNLGRKLNEKLPYRSLVVVNILFSLIAGAILFMIIAAAIAWLYEIQNLERFYLIFGVFGAAFGIIIVAITKPRQPLPIGLILYTITRTVLNVVRSIEALIMAIVAVIWVGIGPFAGVLALGLHTIASLAKLYSEQVESILPGPLEAVTATGATRLQTIIYAVIPQIIPPYISFTMYRWDINVRMSTIIGFAGGGGIGFLLIQNINLLNYRAASTQMLAIAIVVAAMDYFSSWMREKYV